jgi:hypothetical protein
LSNLFGFFDFLKPKPKPNRVQKDEPEKSREAKGVRKSLLPAKGDRRKIFKQYF